MKKFLFSACILYFVYCLLLPANAQFGAQNQPNQIRKNDEIQVLGKADKMLRKRQEEAYKLIAEGKKLIKKGERHKRQDLITKGNIKKEIGENQLKLLKEQTQKKKEEDQSYEW